MLRGEGKRRATLKNTVPRAARRHLLRVSDWGYRSRSAVASLRSGARATSTPDSAQLEGVVILGMHRSGTSLVTRLVNLLGLAVCREDDLLVGLKSNPRGHWESMSLLAFNDRLLDELAATWFCPPSPSSDELSRMRDRHAAGALARLRACHPEPPWVWKDPRTCLLLPFWSAVLAGRAAYVLVVRHPFEVSDSLARRNGCAPQLSLALWERYTRQAMLGASGRPTMVCTYDQVLADPRGWCERLVAFLGELGAPELTVEEAVGAFAVDGLRHSHASWTELQAGPRISPAQATLADAATVPVTAESYVPPALPPETPQTEAIFGEIRRHLANQRNGRRRLRDLPPHLVSPRPQGEGARQVSGPPVSVVLAQQHAGVEVSNQALAETLPAGSEIVLVGAAREPTGGWSGAEDVSIRTVDCERLPGGAEALALGAAAARGSIVLLAAAGLVRCDPWYAPVKQALGPDGVGGVGATMRFTSRPEQRWFGRAFSDYDLTSGLVAGNRTQKPVRTALLLAGFSAYERKVLTASGGLDRAFSSAGAAIAELSIRVWRMGFHCLTIPQVEVWCEDVHAPGLEHDAEDDAERLYDRMRIATLHLDPARLRAFTERAARLPAYDRAVERLMASDVEHRRAAITAVCAFPVDRYFKRFPLVPETRG
jgi:hypothetical protein